MRPPAFGPSWVPYRGGQAPPRESVPGDLPRLRGGSAWSPGAPGGHPAQASWPPRDPLLGPASGAPKVAKSCDFLTPCGAQSWGSGGAPPTDLILLRNQRRPEARRRRTRASRRTERVGGPGHPSWPGCGLLQAGRWGWGVGWSPEWVVTRGMRKASCLILAPRAGPLTSVCDMSPTAAVVGTPFAPWSGVRRRSYRVSPFDHIQAMPYRYRSSVRHGSLLLSTLFSMLDDGQRRREHLHYPSSVTDLRSLTVLDLWISSTPNVKHYSQSAGVALLRHPLCTRVHVLPRASHEFSW